MYIHTTNYTLKDKAQQLQTYNKDLAKNILKEYLQDLVLDIIYHHPKYKNLIFYGGTTLRKIYGIDRVSEDLDFESRKTVDLEDIKNMFTKKFKEEKMNFVDISTQCSEKINRCILKFAILYELGLSNNKNEKLHIKVEINTQKRKYETKITPYSQGLYSMLIKHYTLPVSMASKMIACTNRIYKKRKSGITIKGRDYYDLLWYMQNKVVPDTKLLKDNGYTTKKIFKEIGEKVEKITSKDLLTDLIALHPDTIYIKDWCKNFHTMYAELYKEQY